jgi:hypothetical protein
LIKNKKIVVDPLSSLEKSYYDATTTVRVFLKCIKTEHDKMVKLGFEMGPIDAALGKILVIFDSAEVVKTGSHELHNSLSS